ncbi:MAG: Ger(x)C family spore germination protein [Clostridiales bacterium]|nr:Ger(x)C family spore germination protein [Clostridiales bacterium]
MMKKNIYKYLLTALLILLLSSQILGCYNYREINKITFVTSMIFDTTDDGNSRLYLDCVIPYRNASESSDKGMRVMFDGIGKTALEAIRNINIDSSNDLNFTQIRSYIFTEKAAKEGINKYIDLIDKNQELGYKSYMFVYYGDIKELLEKTSKDEEYLGLYLDNLIEMNKKNGKIISSNVSDYMTKSLQKSQISLLTNIEIKNDLIDKKIVTNGGTIMKNGVMLQKLQEDETSYYNLLTKNIKEGSIIVPNPNDNNEFITLNVIENIISMNSHISDNKVIIENNVNIKSSIGEIQGSLSLNKDVEEQIINSAEKTLSEKLNKFIIKMYDSDIDLLSLDRFMEINYKNYNKNILDNKLIRVNVKLSIEGSGLSKDSLF